MKDSRAMCLLVLLLHILKVKSASCTKGFPSTQGTTDLEAAGIVKKLHSSACMCLGKLCKELLDVLLATCAQDKNIHGEASEARVCQALG